MQACKYYAIFVLKNEGNLNNQTVSYCPSYLFADVYFLGDDMYVLLYEQQKTVVGLFERNGSGELHRP